MIDFDEEDTENFDENAIDNEDELEEKNNFPPDIAPPTNKNDDENTVYLKQSEENTNHTEDELEPKSVKEEILKQRKEIDFKITDTDAIRMVETFKTIGTSTFELAALADTTIFEVKKVLELGEKKSEEIQDITNIFYENKEEFLQVLLKFKEYFDSDENIIYKIERLEQAIQHNYGKFATSLDAMSELHTSIIEENLGQLSKKIGKISDDVDVDSVIDNINIKIDEEFKNVKIDKLEESLNRFNRLNKNFIESSVLLEGTKDGKKGLFYALSDQLDNLEKHLNKLKRGFNFAGMIGAFIVGSALSSSIVFGYLSNKYVTTKSLFNADLDNQIKISKKLKNLENKYKGYSGFVKKYGLNGNKKAGFGYFENNGHPYFSYSPNLKVYRMNGKNYVDLGAKKP